MSVKAWKIWEEPQASFISLGNYHQETDQEDGLYLYQMNLPPKMVDYPTGFGYYAILGGVMVEVSLKIHVMREELKHFNKNSFVAAFRHKAEAWPMEVKYGGIPKRM